MADNGNEYVPRSERPTEIIYRGPNGQPLPGSTPDEINPEGDFTLTREFPAIPKDRIMNPQGLPAVKPPPHDNRNK